MYLIKKNGVEIIGNHPKMWKFLKNQIDKQTQQNLPKIKENEAWRSKLNNYFRIEHRFNLTNQQSIGTENFPISKSTINNEHFIRESRTCNQTSGISGVGAKMRGDNRFLSLLRTVWKENQRNAVKIDKKVGENKETQKFKEEIRVCD